MWKYMNHTQQTFIRYQDNIGRMAFVDVGDISYVDSLIGITQIHLKDGTILESVEPVNILFERVGAC